MSPVSPVFHTEVTISIGLKWVKTELAFCFEEWAFHYSMKEWAFCYEGRVLGFQIEVLTLIQNLTENRLRHPRGPVQFHLVGYINSSSGLAPGI